MEGPLGREEDDPGIDSLNPLSAICIVPQLQ